MSERAFDVEDGDAEGGDEFAMSVDHDAGRVVLTADLGGRTVTLRFRPEQARHLAEALLGHADEADQ
jgi:hypothetical protein